MEILLLQASTVSDGVVETPILAQDLDDDENIHQNKMTTIIQQNNYMDGMFEQAPQLTPVNSGEEIKVLHFARSRD